jgi:hypothetical protein
MNVYDVGAIGNIAPHDRSAFIADVGRSDAFKNRVQIRIRYGL